MRTNTIFTYALYVALAILVTVAGYKACQMKSKQSAKAQEEAELNQRLQELGYVKPDNKTEESSAYLGDRGAEAGSVPSGTPEGIEYTDPAPGTPQPAVTDKPAVRQQNSDLKPAVPTVQKPAPVSTKPATVVTEDPMPQRPVSAPKPAAPTGPTGKYLVVTGSFSVMDNARDEMETLIKMGYVNAEIRKFKPTFATVIALRTNDRKKADAEVAKLKSKGYAGAYVRQ
jgi:cell division septation protein DedD